VEGISNHRCLRARVLPFTVRAPLRGRLCTGSDSLHDGAAHNALARTLHGYRRAADERHLAGIGPVRVRGGIVRVRTYMSFLHSAPTWPCPHQSDWSAPTQSHPLSLPLPLFPRDFFPQHQWRSQVLKRNDNAFAPRGDANLGGRGDGCRARRCSTGEGKRAAP
jgi:hypothetical protein